MLQVSSWAVETKANKKTGSKASRASTVQGEPQRSTHKRTPAATRIMRHEGAHCAEKETISCKVMLGGRARRPIRRRQEPDASGTGLGRRRQYVRDRAENSLYQPPAFGSRASMEDPCQSQSHSRRMVPYGEKQGRGGSLALFTVFRAMVAGAAGQGSPGWQPQKKERKTSHETGGVVWINFRSAIYRELRQKRSLKPQEIDNSSSRHPHACQLGPLTTERGRESGWLAAAQAEVAGSRAGKRQTHLGTAAGPIWNTTIEGPDF